MRKWESNPTEDDRKLYERGFFGARQELGSKPALMVIDSHQGVYRKQADTERGGVRAGSLP
jgi:hypothetical protein